MGRRGKGEGGTLCNRCAASPLAIDGIRSVFVYDGVAREAIIRLKYHGLRSLAGPLGRRMGAYLLANPLPVDTIAPVPLHITRSKMRGYNQADLLTGCVAAATGLRKLDRALIRVRDTPAQVKTASAEERRRNVRGAFKAVEGEVRGRRILVLDDVCTTGSTLEACSTALREAGAGAVWGLTLARET